MLFDDVREKILSDFYLNSFDPVNNLNLSDIFYHFPRLLNVNDVINDNIWSNLQSVLECMVDGKIHIIKYVLEMCPLSFIHRQVLKKLFGEKKIKSGLKMFQENRRGNSQISV